MDTDRYFRRSLVSSLKLWVLGTWWWLGSSQYEPDDEFRDLFRKG